MQNALLVGLSRQMALGRELDVIANNLANVSTNGFKARSSRFAEYLSPTARADAFARPDQRVGYVIDAGTPLDVSAGPVENTGNPLDVSVKGDGFFVVQTPAGERYTRGGSFQVDAAGQLVTNDGYAVMGDSGPIAFGPQETGAAIASDGTVSSVQGQRGKLRLVRFDDPASLASEGANPVSSPRPAPPPAVAARRQPRPPAGALEMTRLMEVNRAYAGVASMIGRIDEMKRSALSRLADASAS